MQKKRKEIINLKKSFLLRKWQIDLFGDFIIKKKFKNKIYQKLLINFENVFRRKFVYRLKNKFKAPFIISWGRWMHKKINIFRKLKKKKFSLDNFHKKDNFFFNQIFNFYKLQTNYSIFENTFITNWKKTRYARLKRKLPKTLFVINNKRYFRKGYRMPYIKKQNIFILKNLEVEKFKNFYCLQNREQIKFLLLKLEKKNKIKFDTYGLNFLLIDFLFRLNIFPTTRFVYNLIKIGGVDVNSKKTFSVYKKLNLYDLITINPLLIKKFFFYFRNRIIKKRLLFNIPNYIDFDYKIFSFSIWRLPNQKEKNLVYNFPFKRSNFIDTELYSFFFYKEKTKKNF